MIYAVDFDGLLCEDAYPEIGAPKTEIIEHFTSLKAQGHKLILWTCREGQSLRDAVNWCLKQGLHFDAYNSNLPEMNAKYGNDCRKVGADYYCDDRNYTPIISNADRIRSMTDEELAQFLGDEPPYFATYKQYIDWLRKPIESEVEP